MLKRMSEQNQISFLSQETIPDIKKAEDNKQDLSLSQIIKEQKSKKLESHDNGFMTSKHISSARTGIIGDNGGPSKQIKMESSNSIFDTDKNSAYSKELDSKTKTKEAKERIAENRRIAEQHRMDELVSNIKDTMTDKGSSVTPASHLSGSNYVKSKNNFSIFDNKDFERVPEKTAGERLSEENVVRRAQKDESWRNGGKSKTMKESVDSFFGDLFNK